MISNYYQAHIIKDKIWIVTALLRNEDHWAFDRTLDTQTNLLEFFVSPFYDEEFCSLMKWFQEQNYIISFTKLNNRIIDNKNF